MDAGVRAKQKAKAEDAYSELYRTILAHVLVASAFPGLDHMFQTWSTSQVPVLVSRHKHMTSMDGGNAKESGTGMYQCREKVGYLERRSGTILAHVLKKPG